MKKFAFLLFTCLISLSSFAQYDNVIIKQVPQKFKINDKIILVNKSPYHILQAVIALCKENGDYLPLAAPATSIASNQEVEYASFEYNRLKQLKGRNIAIKVKALKRPIEQIDDLDSVNPEDITYNFDVTLSENRHDLIITISSKSASGNVMDF